MIVEGVLMVAAFGVGGLCFWVIRRVLIEGVKDEEEFPLDCFEEAAESC